MALLGALGLVLRLPLSWKLLCLPLPMEPSLRACATTDGTPVGRVVAVENFGAGDILEIEKLDGKRFMVPMNVRAVPIWTDDGVTIDAAFVE